ncbi:hypothetical protein [Castellaniella defragrans]|uniref:hypothetical protein n=1 Tax=Castellaniella defragrans TaxID=75697 RepID=UPI00130D78AC
MIQLFAWRWVTAAAAPGFAFHRAQSGTAWARCWAAPGIRPNQRGARQNLRHLGGDQCHCRIAVRRLPAEGQRDVPFHCATADIPDVPSVVQKIGGGDEILAQPVVVTKHQHRSTTQRPERGRDAAMPADLVDQCQRSREQFLPGTTSPKISSANLLKRFLGAQAAPAMKQ